jgi:uncharacterized Zn-binding protein involved in type VI secretion
MPEAARLNDADSSDGHLIDAAASTVKINGQFAALVGSVDRSHAPYPRPRNNPHPPHQAATITQGSGTVRIEGKAAARKGDPLSCGHIVNAGSPNVKIG